MCRPCMAPDGVLVVHLVKAQNLKDKASVGRQDTFVQLEVNGRIETSKTAYSGHTNPKFNERIKIKDVKELDKLVIKVYKKRILKQAKAIGQGSVLLDASALTGTEVTVPLVYPKKPNEPAGEMKLTLCLKPAEASSAARRNGFSPVTILNPAATSPPQEQPFQPTQPPAQPQLPPQRTTPPRAPSPPPAPAPAPAPPTPPATSSPRTHYNPHPYPEPLLHLPSYIPQPTTNHPTSYPSFSDPNPPHPTTPTPPYIPTANSHPSQQPQQQGPPQQQPTSSIRDLRRLLLETLSGSLKGRPMPPGSIAMLRQQLQQLDRQHTGRISRAALEEEFRSQKLHQNHLMSALLGEVLALADGQQVGYEAVLARMEEERSRELLHRLHDMFSQLDVDGRATVPREQLQEVLGLNAAEVEQLLEEVDVDGDDCVNFEEFCQLMRSHSQRFTVC